MAMKTVISSTTDTAILSRLIRPEEDNLQGEAARALLDIRFDKLDLARMHELVTKNQDGRLKPAEMIELENYRRVSFLLDLMHSKARRSLKKQQVVSTTNGG